MGAEFKPVSYKQARLDASYDAIVIGSGIGGLTAAVMLAKHAGKRVLVLERHYTAGGFTHTFTRPGFEWDVGLHYIGQVENSESTGRKIFDHLTDGQLKWAPMPDVYDRIVIGDKTFDFQKGLERFREQLKNYFPRDARAIDRYIDAVNRSVRWSTLYFAEKLLPPFLSALLGRALRWPYLRSAGRTTLSVLNDFTSNPELIGVLTAIWGDYGLPPAESSFGMHAIIAKHYFEGASYPVGGAGAVVQTMAPIIERAGGNIVVNAEVQCILVERGQAVGVRMADGREILAPLVISDAGAPNTLNRLVRMNTPALERVRAGMRKIPPSSSHLCLYVGLEGTAADLGLNGTNLWVCPSLDHDASVKRFASDPDAPFPAVFISFPSAKDPSFEERHPGHSTIEVITFAPYDWFTRWEETRWKKRGPGYEAFKEKLTSRLLDVLYCQVPAVRGHVLHAELSTPLTTRHFSNHAHGEIYGLAHSPARFAFRGLGPRTPIRNLYLTGQDAALSGITGAVAGGIMAASAVLGRNMFFAIEREKALTCTPENIDAECRRAS